MKRPFILIILTIPTILIQTTHAQKPASKRFISYAVLTDPLNEPFHRPETDVTGILFDGAKKGLIPLYYFDSFKKTPKPFSPKQLADKLHKLDQLRFKPWVEGEVYPRGAGVSFREYRYRSMRDNNDTYPLDFNSWEYMRTPATIIGIDYQVEPPGTFTIQYIHFYSDDFKYEVSFKASDAADFLNKTGYLWYRIEDHFIHHLSGEIFLFDYYDPGKIVDLWPLLDTARLGISRETFSGNAVLIGLQSAYHNGRVTDFVLTNENGMGSTSSLLDTVSISEIRKNLEKDTAEFYLIGDALLKPQLLKFSASHPTAELKAFQTRPEPRNESQVETISYRAQERFRLFGQNDNPKTFEKNVGELMNLLYEGISEKSIRVYSSDSLNHAYTPEELVRQWHAGQSPVNWDAKAAYSYENEVVYNGVVYVAIEKDSAGGPPSGKKDRWKVKPENEEIFQPDDIQQFEFVYQISLTRTAKLISKEPVSVGMLCRSNQFDYVSTLGYLDFKELKNLITKKDPGLWKKVASWLGGQDGVYQMIKYDPLKADKR